MKRFATWGRGDLERVFVFIFILGRGGGGGGVEALLAGRGKRSGMSVNHPPGVGCSSSPNSSGVRLPRAFRNATGGEIEKRLALVLPTIYGFK